MAKSKMRKRTKREEPSLPTAHRVQEMLLEHNVVTEFCEWLEENTDVELPGGAEDLALSFATDDDAEEDALSAVLEACEK